MIDSLLAKLVGKYSEYIILIILVLFGSATNATVLLKQSREKSKPFGLADFFIAMFLASFSGMVFGFAASAWGFTDEKLYLMVSAGSFLGLVGLNKLLDIVMDVFKARVGK